jgi:hypothetical protein
MYHLTKNHKMVTLSNVPSFDIQSNSEKNRADTRIGKGEIGHSTGAIARKRATATGMG